MRVHPIISTSLIPNVREVTSVRVAVVLKTSEARSLLAARTPEGAGAAMLLWPEPTTKSTPRSFPSTGITPTV